MVTAVAPRVEVDISIPEKLLIATADTLPGWLRQETLGTPTLPSYSAGRRESGIWEFRAGRGYFELEYHSPTGATQRTSIEIGVRVIDGIVFAGVRANAAAPNADVDAGLVKVIAAIDAASGGILAAALLEQLHELAAGKGRGMKTVDPVRTRRLFMQIKGGAA